MPLVLEEVSAEQDFDEIATIVYAAFGHPYNALRQWFIPIHTTIEAALNEFTIRSVKSWKQNSDMHWLKVTDTETGRIIGAAEWEVRKTIETQSSELKPFNVHWHIDGSEEQQFAEQMLTQFRAFKVARMGRPHLELGQIAVRPGPPQKGRRKAADDLGHDKGR